MLNPISNTHSGFLFLAQLWLDDHKDGFLKYYLELKQFDKIWYIHIIGLLAGNNIVVSYNVEGMWYKVISNYI